MLSEIAIHTALHILINYIASHYFLECHTTCYVYENALLDISLPAELPIVVISNSPGHGTDSQFYDGIERGINWGCKCWVVEASLIPLFLDNYGNITSTEGLEQRPIRPKFIIYGFPENSLVEQGAVRSLLSHSLMKNVPDVLLVLPSADAAFDFDLLTAKFVGRLNNSTPVLIESVRINSSLAGSRGEGVGGGSENDEVDAITFKFGHREPQHRQHELYDRRKVFNLHDRHLAAAMFRYKPYATLTEVPEGTGNANSRELYLAATKQAPGVPAATDLNATFSQLTLQFDGIDGMAMVTLCEKYNCTLLMEEDNEYQWGEVFENYTGNGILGRVVEKTTEVAITSMYNWYHEYLFMEFSMPISRSGTTALVPKPKFLEAALIALMPFSQFVWLTLAISFCTVTLMNYVVDKAQERIFSLSSRSFLESYFFVLQVFVEQPSGVYRCHLFVKRFLVALILVEGFVMGSVFAGSLLSYLAVPRQEPPIDTPADLARSGFHWGESHLAWIYSILDTNNPITMTVRDNFEVHPKERLAELSTQGTFGFAIEHLDYGYFAFGDYLTPKSLQMLRPMREDIMYGPIVAGFVRSWYLKDEFDELLMRISQSGIQSYWLLDITYRQLDPLVQRTMKLSNHAHGAERMGSGDGNAAPLKIDRMVGMFYMLAFGLLLGVAVFIGELCHSKMNARAAVAAPGRNKRGKTTI